MWRNFTCSFVCVCCSVASVVSVVAPASAQSSSYWDVYVGPSGPGHIIGAPIGVAPWATDGFDGGGPTTPNPDSSGIQIQFYRVHDIGWDGPTGFFAGDHDFTQIPAGGSRTWSDFYLWAQNYTPVNADCVTVNPRATLHIPPPAGYQGHLVLDYVPSSCNYTGPADYWLDLTAYNELALPIPVVTDPLQGTRFHLTVYATVPEPASLAALAMGLAGIGGFAIRRKR